MDIMDRKVDRDRFADGTASVADRLAEARQRGHAFSVDELAGLLYELADALPIFASDTDTRRTFGEHADQLGGLGELVDSLDSRVSALERNATTPASGTGTAERQADAAPASASAASSTPSEDKTTGKGKGSPSASG